jgi:N6-L-threonylcarbamoyladenine synthase
MILAVETSCDETAVAVVHEGRVLSSLVSSQTKLHEEYGGVVPELAAREHLTNLLPIAHEAIAEACASHPSHPSSSSSNGPETTEDEDEGRERGRALIARVDAIACTLGPGLPGALLVGVKAAEAMAFVLRRPFIGIHHHEAHLYSPWVRGNPIQSDFESLRPHVCLIVSGGHTMLVHVRGPLEHHVLGSTLDDAAGECFDKVGKLLGLAYPAGPIVDRLAAEGDPRAFEFPRPKLHDDDDDFSFSGLKTSVRYFLRDHPGLADDPEQLRNLCSSVQAAIVDVLVGKTLRAAKRLGVRCVTAAGGVTCNSELRRRLAERCAREKLKLRLADASLCTDNAAMVGLLAERKLAHGQGVTDLDAEPAPGWTLA